MISDRDDANRRAILSPPRVCMYVCTKAVARVRESVSIHRVLPLILGQSRRDSASLDSPVARPGRPILESAGGREDVASASASSFDPSASCFVGAEETRREGEEVYMQRYIFRNI